MLKSSRTGGHGPRSRETWPAELTAQWMNRWMTQPPTQPTAQLAAQLAKQYNIKIYTILVGKEGKVPIGKDKQGIMLYDDNTIDETTLKNIAKTADGAFFRATNNETLQEIFAKISKYETTEILETRNTQTRDFYQVYLAWAVVFWLIWLILKATFINNFLED